MGSGLRRHPPSAEPGHRKEKSGSELWRLLPSRWSRVSGLTNWAVRILRAWRRTPLSEHLGSGDERVTLLGVTFQRSHVWWKDRVAFAVPLLFPYAVKSLQGDRPPRSGNMPGKFERAMDHHYCIRAEPAVLFRARTQPRRAPPAGSTIPQRSPPGREAPLGSAGGTGRPTDSGLSHSFREKELPFRGRGRAVRARRDGVLFRDRTPGGWLAPRIVHGGFPHRGEWVDLYEGADPGWAYFERNLKVVREQRPDLQSESQGWV